MKKLLTLLIAMVFLMNAQAKGQEKQDYIVGEGDILTITVYEHDDLTTKVRVGADGTIVMPLIGPIVVTGLPVSQVSKKISIDLADGYIIDPQVNVFVEEFRSKKAVILGFVNKPGLYELRGDTTFLELISKAGGLTKEAGGKAILKRKAALASSETEKIITIDLKALIEEGDMSLDATILDGDSIYISKAGVFYVTGEVRKPDAYKYEPDTTVIKAITMAGGFNDKAAEENVKIIRKIDGKEEILEKVKMDKPVMAEDVIVVPESFF